MRTAVISLLLCCMMFMNSCSMQKVKTEDHEEPGISVSQNTEKMELKYAREFTAEYTEDGCSLVTIGGSDRYLIVPQGKEPENVPDSCTVLRQPVENIYVAASSAMDLFFSTGAAESVAFTSTSASDWSLEEIRKLVEDGTVQYAGKYSKPDYEMLISGGCGLAVESTMIYHSPAVKEQLERSGIPVLTERSSYESHPLGRMEWIKLYGLLTGREEEAERIFEEKLKITENIKTAGDSVPTAVFFYFSSGKYVNVRKPGDYISEMIRMAGGQYILDADDLKVDENALSTMNMQVEAFYQAAKDADYIFYNSTVDGGIKTLDELIALNEIMSDFRAVKNGNVWCTNKNLFQKTTGAADMIADFNSVFSGSADGEDVLRFMYRLR